MDQRPLTVIQADGTPLETLTSHEVHSRGLLHRSIHILVVNDRGDLFVRRRPGSKEFYPGVWSSSVGAHVLDGETPIQAAEKNLKVYLGLEVPVTVLAEAPIHDAVENELITYFVAKSNNIDDLNPEESSEGRFMSPNELTTLIENHQTTPHLATGFRIYQQWL